MQRRIGLFVLIGLLLWITPLAEARDFKVYGYPIWIRERWREPIGLTILFAPMSRTLS